MELSARLELPAGTSLPKRYALFAHCFTCGKQVKAAISLSRALTQSGFGVLRFDFTGLGESEGEFEESTFSSNVSDLISAGAFLEEHHLAPALLIGHSFGGTAVLHAATHLESVKAVCTIAAPYDVSHVAHLFEDDMKQIRARGSAVVHLGGRPFQITQSFLDDLSQNSTAEVLKKFNKALLIMHSPQDQVVSIDNAAAIYRSVNHPKSFVSLEGADHLLSDARDSSYAAQVLGAWVARYSPPGDAFDLSTEAETAVQLGSDGFTTEVVAGSHAFLVDEPLDVGGNNLGPSPYQLLNAALGSCTAMTLKMYADKKKWPLEKVRVHVNHDHVHAMDSAQAEAQNSKVDVFDRSIAVSGDLSQEQLDKLLEIANKCPVHRTLTSTTAQVRTSINRDEVA